MMGKVSYKYNGCYVFSLNHFQWTWFLLWSLDLHKAKRQDKIVFVNVGKCVVNR